RFVGRIYPKKLNGLIFQLIFIEIQMFGRTKNNGREKIQYILVGQSLYDDFTSDSVDIANRNGYFGFIFLQIHFLKLLFSVEIGTSELLNFHKVNNPDHTKELFSTIPSFGGVRGGFSSTSPSNPSNFAELFRVRFGIHGTDF